MIPLEFLKLPFQQHDDNRCQCPDRYRFGFTRGGGAMSRDDVGVQDLRDRDLNRAEDRLLSVMVCVLMLTIAAAIGTLAPVIFVLLKR